MKKILFLILLGTTSAIGQVLSNQPVVNQIAGQNPFLDASTNFGDSGSIGKGMVFPRTDLTTWTFDTSALDGINFPTAFDGMIVYNTGSGNTVSGQGNVVAVTPGFYYFYNPTGTDNITTGEWRKMGSGSSDSLWQYDGSVSETHPITGDLVTRDSISVSQSDKRILFKYGRNHTDLLNTSSLSLETINDANNKIASTGLTSAGTLNLMRTVDYESPQFLGIVSAKGDDFISNGFDVRMAFMDNKRHSNASVQPYGYQFQVYSKNNLFVSSIDQKRVRYETEISRITTDSISGFKYLGVKNLMGNTLNGNYKFASFMTNSGYDGAGSSVGIDFSVHKDIAGDGFGFGPLRIQRVNGTTSTSFIDLGIDDGIGETVSKGLGFGYEDVTHMVLKDEGGNGNLGVGTLDPDVKLDVNGYLKLGSSDVKGDATPVEGMMRYNSTTKKFQGYDGVSWIDLN